MDNTSRGQPPTETISTPISERIALPVADLRDYFAAQALVGYCIGTPDPEDWHPELLAVAAYDMADHMLKERIKT